MEFRFLRALAIAGALVFFVACAPVENKEVQVEPPLIVAPTRAPTEIANDAQTIARATETRAPARAITLDLSDDKPDASAQNRAGVPVYTAFDFLRGYLTNQTHAIFFEGKPWTNSTVNVAQVQQELGGVSYWDFFSELENWDSPFFMWQQDDGQWRPYSQEKIRDARGRDVNAYLLLDRAGPGALDRLWFTQDAVWMLETAESRANVGAIENLQEFIEWGNLEKLGNLRIEVDDHIAYDGAIKDWFSGNALGLTSELAKILTWRHREFGSSGSIVPLPYQKHLRVLVYGGTKKPKWFLATGMRFPDATRVKSFSISDLPIGEMTRLAANVLQPERFLDSLDNARAYDLVAQANAPATIRAEGAGTIRALQFIVAKKFDSKQLRLRVKYGNEIGMDLPLLAFFSDPAQLALHRSTPIGVVETNDAYIFYSNLPMPFQTGITIELATNEANPIVITARVALARETTNAQLWTVYRDAEKLAMHGPDYQVKIPGAGKLVGLVLETKDQDLEKIPKVYARPNEEDPVKRAWAMGYLEGNLALADGIGNARVYGGHEDWADGGFYFNRGYTNPPGGSNRPFGGILRYKDGKDGYATLFRYFNDLSAFRFKNGLQMNFQHGTWQNNFAVKFGATVIYYREIGGVAARALPAREYVEK